MASSPTLLSSLLLLLLFSSTISKSTKPKALVFPITKHIPTLQYTTTLHQPPKTSKPLLLPIDLGGRFTWVNCDSPSYLASSYRPVPCETPLCVASFSGACTTECNSPKRPGCNNNTCSITPENPFIRLSTSGELGTDSFDVRSTDGSNPGREVRVKKMVVGCGGNNLVEGLVGGVSGLLALGRIAVAAPTVFAAEFGFERKFAVCLPSTQRATGVLFFGGGPYKFLHNKIDISQSLLHTPLLKNPVSTAGAHFEGEPSFEYFIGVNSIQVNGKSVPLNTTLLGIDKKGVGGTKISTVNPYTVLETSIYNAVVKSFTKESGLARVLAVKPFKHCFDARNVGSTRVGPGVPAIDLVLESKTVFWRIFGANSMVHVKDGVLCLAFVDGGREPTTSIVIGSHQLEDNLLQFDLAKSRLGFSSSLLFRQTNCGNFNFTINNKI